MSFSLRDRMSVAFHQITGGNISTKTAERLSTILMKMDKVENAGASLVRALQQKLNTSHNTNLSQITAALAHIAAKEAEHELAARLEKRQDKINFTHSSVDRFLLSTHTLATQIEKLLKNSDLKNEVSFRLLRDYGLEIDAPKALAVELYDKQYELDKSLAQLKLVQQNSADIAGMKDKTHEDHQQQLAWERQSTLLSSKIVRLEAEILQVREKLAFAHYAKAMTVIAVADNNHVTLSADCWKLLNSYNKVMNAPENIRQSHERMAAIDKPLKKATE